MTSPAPFRPIRLAGHRLRAEILPFGASLVSLVPDGLGRSIVLGHGNREDYAKHPKLYMGAVIGRHANRIAFGRTLLDGQTLKLDLNAPPHHSAGGAAGFSTQTFRVGLRTRERVALHYHSPDGEGGYPGALDVSVTYELAPPSTLRLTLEATTTAPTILSMCHHPYFDLDGRRDVRDHELQVHAERYLPCDDTVLPTGDVVPVKGTGFDFRTARRFASAPGWARLNNTFRLHDMPEGPLRPAATLWGADGTRLDLATTMPGLHVYSGHRLSGTAHGADGQQFEAFSGLCLEAQAWPDAPNNPLFPSVVLRPERGYRHVTEYRIGLQNEARRAG
ncbi:aldose epimerase family protein [Histidinibacterium aquaticum]|uniref:Aldose 1-epimerase n=1 Tax=Histidinibacterium aquaticum TaxID=2613962 RepID=A0A5J5GKU1_9RHOB|nr:aldose epimerase family protein [Histidinibacterium aquaticum]KAA9008750.1 galactose mutarotase [Histidinibacterium aquaticum]